MFVSHVNLPHFQQVLNFVQSISYLCHTCRKIICLHWWTKLWRRKKVPRKRI